MKHARRRGFFLLLFALSVPFWLAGGTTAWQPLPGVPISALMFVCPSLAAALLVWRESGFNETKKLRIHGPIWILPILLLMPGVMLLSYAVMRLFGHALPTLEIDFRVLLLLFGAFLGSAIGEQLGWSLRARPVADAVPCPIQNFAPPTQVRGQRLARRILVRVKVPHPRVLEGRSQTERFGRYCPAAEE